MHRPRATSDSPVRLVAQGGGDSLGVAPVPPIPKSGERARSPAVAPALPAAERAPLEAEPLAAYRAAYAELTAGRYDDAEQKLRAFVKRYPRHDYADNAQYWLGECFYARHRYQEAAVEFRAAVAKYPVGNKAPDALLKLAYSLLSLGEKAEARRLLEELPGTYPRSDAARLATQKLAELGGNTPWSTSAEEPR
jgi:tol-pal system protein YbgF